MRQNIKPYLQINVFYSKESGEVGKVVFSRSGGWHEESCLAQLDVLNDTIYKLNERCDALSEQYYKEIRSENAKKRRQNLRASTHGQKGIPRWINYSGSKKL